MKLSAEDIKQNKYYVGHGDSVVRRGWGHAKLADAMEHAERMTNENHDVLVVKIVRVVRRVKPPVTVEVIK